MEFIKKHYEKIILSVVLLGLVGALVFLPFLIEADQERNPGAPYLNNKTPLPKLDMTRQDNVLNRLNSPYNLDFSTTNRLFNPLEWQKGPNGPFPIKNGNEVGPAAAVVTKITPLYLVVTLDEVQTNDLGALGAVYVIGIERQAAPSLPLRHKQQHYATKGEKIPNAFTLSEVEGDPVNPDQLTLKLADTGETAVVSKDKPFQRVDGYAADLKYPPENKTFPGRRVGSSVPFGGEDYLVVAIGQNEVILSAQSNQKKTTLRYAP